MVALEVVLGGGAAGAESGGGAAETKTLQMPIRTDGPKSLDPAVGSTQYDNLAASQIFETLVTFSYAKPGELEPLLLATMPTTADGGLTWAFTLKPGVRFQDNACFPGGKGRGIRSEDVFYSLKRLADKRNELRNWWLLEGAVKGFDQFKSEQNGALDSGKPFDYDAPVAGFVRIDDSRFEIVLTKPVYRFLYVLAQFQASVVPREAVEKYGKDFTFNPVGTGPFMLEKWEPKQLLWLVKNPGYHDVRYPAREQWSREDRRRRMDRAAGERVPLVDRIEFTMYVQNQPMWLQFLAGKLGYIEVPSEYFEEAFDKRTKEPKPEIASRGVSFSSDPLLDFVFTGFNMADPVLGGMDEKGRKLRQAVHLAIDLNEVNEAFYQGICSVFDGPIPVGLEGHPEGGKAPVSFRGPDLDRAKKSLAEAGWPEGKNAKTGEQLVLRYYTDNSLVSQQQSEMYKRQIERLGVRFDPVLLDFSTLIENINNKKAPMFGFAWGSDYPDAENNLALFYGPNEAPGSNHYNYKNPEYDRLYERVCVMAPGPERTKLYEQMRDTIIADTPYTGSLGRTRFYLMAPWILNCRPTERVWSWLKYLDVDDSKRAR